MPSQPRRYPPTFQSPKCNALLHLGLLANYGNKCTFDTMKSVSETYRIERQEWGAWEVITLSLGDNAIAFVPQYGGHLLRLDMEVDGQRVNVIDGYHTPEELAEQDFYKSSFLMPFPNRLDKGQFTYAGQSYQFPINDQATGNALHGFKAFYEMELTAITPLPMGGVQAELTSRYDGTHPAYPFPFTFTVQYRLLAHNQFECAIHITNTHHSTIPVGFGWHPYFTLGTDTVDSLLLQMPTAHRVEIDQRMLPNGTTTPFETFRTPHPLAGQQFDNAFILPVASSWVDVHLIAPSRNTQLTFWQEAETFPYFQLFIPPRRQSVAIEPMTCNINALNQELPRVQLEAGATRSGRFGVQVSPWQA